MNGSVAPLPAADVEAWVPPPAEDQPVRVTTETAVAAPDSEGGSDGERGEASAPGSPVTAASAPAAFAAFLEGGRSQATSAGRRRGFLIVSVVVHAAVLGIAAQQVVSPPAPQTPQVAVTILRQPILPTRAPPAAAPAAPAPKPRVQAARSRPKVRPEPVPVPVVVPEPAEGPAEEAPAEETTAAPEQTVLTTAAAAIGGDGHPQGRPGVGRSDPELRRQLINRYAQEIFRSRIARVFRYPPQAERYGLAGVVVVRATIRTGGSLVSVEVLGTCPHPILCRAAVDTLKAAAPFPPPPAELGGSIQVDIPLRYELR